MAGALPEALVIVNNLLIIDITDESFEIWCGVFHIFPTVTAGDDLLSSG